MNFKPVPLFYYRFSIEENLAHHYKNYPCFKCPLIPPSHRDNQRYSSKIGLVLLQNSLFATTPLSLEKKIGRAFAEFSVTSNQDAFTKEIKAIQEETNATPSEILSALALETGLPETTVDHIADYTHYTEHHNIPMDEATTKMTNVISKSSPTGSNFLGEVHPIFILAAVWVPLLLVLWPGSRLRLVVSV